METLKELDQYELAALKRGCSGEPVHFVDTPRVYNGKKVTYTIALDCNGAMVSAWITDDKTGAKLEPL